MIKELSLKRDKLTIYGKLFLPNNSKETHPAVIFAHGFGSNHAKISDYAEFFIENNITCCVFDFCGGSNESLSDGNTLNMSVLTETEDMNSILNELKKLDYIDKNNIFLMGESQGGYVASLLASKRESDINGLILLYPAFVILDDTIKRTKNGTQIPDKINVRGIEIGKKYSEDALSIDIYDEIQKFHKDVLIIHGDNDTIVPLKYSIYAKECYAKAKLVVLKGANHGFNGKNKLNAANLSIEYIKDHLN